MIVRNHNGGLLLVRQTDHAALSGVLAEHWGNDSFAPPEPYEPVRLASAMHDDGWMEWEAAPKIDPETRLPFQFTDLPVQEHLTFYLRGVAQVLEKDRYAGLLVSMHCTGIYRQRYGTDPGLKLKRFTPDVQAVVDNFMERLETQQRESREELRASGFPPPLLEEGRIWTNYKLLQMMDRLSLYFCMAPLVARSMGPAPFDSSGSETELALRPTGDAAVTVSPYPFRSSPLRVSVAARLVARRTYRSDDEFRETFSAAERVPLEFELRGG